MIEGVMIKREDKIMHRPDFLLLPLLSFLYNPFYPSSPPIPFLPSTLFFHFPPFIIPSNLFLHSYSF